MKWIEALKLWNAKQDKWTIPKRGTPEHAAVKALMGSTVFQTKKKRTKQINADKVYEIDEHTGQISNQIVNHIKG